MWSQRVRAVWKGVPPPLWGAGAPAPNWTMMGPRRGYPGYKNFGHKREVEPLLTKITLGIFGSVLIVSVLDWRWLRMLYLHHTGQLKKKPEDAPLEGGQPPK